MKIELFSSWLVNSWLDLLQLFLSSLNFNSLLFIFYDTDRTTVCPLCNQRLMARHAEPLFVNVIDFIQNPSRSAGQDAIPAVDPLAQNDVHDQNIHANDSTQTDSVANAPAVDNSAQDDAQNSNIDENDSHDETGFVANATAVVSRARGNARDVGTNHVGTRNVAGHRDNRRHTGISVSRSYDRHVRILRDESMDESNDERQFIRRSARNSCPPPRYSLAISRCSVCRRTFQQVAPNEWYSGPFACSIKCFVNAREI